MAKQNIVIIGAGFGGIRAAQDIGRGLLARGLTERYEAVLIDRHPFHVYTPLLYKFAATAGDEEKRLALPVETLLGALPVRFIEDEALSLDARKGTVLLRRGGELDASCIVLTPGSETNFFDIPGLSEHALPLKTIEDAERIRAALAGLGGKSDPTVLVGGAGPTGLEFAAEVKVNHPDLRVIVVEAMPAPLPGFAPRLVRAAGWRVNALGVGLLVGAPIVRVENGKATTKEGTVIPFDLFVWTGGVKAPAWLLGLDLKTEPRGKMEADKSLACVPASPELQRGEPQNEDLPFGANVYAVGDAVCITDPATGKPLPGVAHTAMTQGALAAANILADIDGRPRRAYRHRAMPYVLPLGGRYAIAKIGPLLLKGYPAWLFKEAIELYYRLTIMPLRKALGI